MHRFRCPVRGARPALPRGHPGVERRHPDRPPRGRARLRPDGWHLRRRRSEHPRRGPRPGRSRGRAGRPVHAAGRHPDGELRARGGHDHAPRHALRALAGRPRRGRRPDRRPRHHERHHDRRSELPAQPARRQEAQGPHPRRASGRLAHDEPDRDAVRQGAQAGARLGRRGRSGQRRLPAQPRPAHPRRGVLLPLRGQRRRRLHERARRHRGRSPTACSPRAGPGPRAAESRWRRSARRRSRA